jgi:hypothetical protein
LFRDRELSVFVRFRAAGELNVPRCCHSLGCLWANEVSRTFPIGGIESPNALVRH